MSNKQYPTLASSKGVPRAEEALMAYWDEADLVRRAVEERPESKPYVFYEGPPTANGRPGVHHVIARLTKDLACRYQTMLGHRVVRKGGWDTHGLPVEIEVENELGIKRKEEIEQYGIAEFNQKCRESVFKYEKDWVEFTHRIGYWLDMHDPYITCDNRYIESVWWILKEFWNKDLIYKGHKIVPYCPRCETSLSSHEVSQGYKDVSDPSIYVKFKRQDADEKFLVWTTTPWTLISNVALAVGPTYDYVRVRHHDDTLILAEALLPALDGDYELVDKFKGADLVGATYEPLLPYYEDERANGAFRVVSGDFVSLEDGTGIVHIAPAFGEDDYQLHREHGVPLVQAVTPSGRFVDRVTEWADQFIKDADPSITKHLKDEGKLYKSGKIKHSYPFCWRCATPLVYYARQSWYIATTSFKDEMIAANKTIGWIPAEVGEHRFGNWLENNVDWSLSRERYWGTPLPIWECECGHREAVGSIEELETRAVTKPDGELDLHRPWVDEVEFECEKCKGRMKRVSEVIDVWFDSGSMPFAQYHYPWNESGMFESQFPADFISEGIDQCRGWFYSLLAISVFLTGKSPYKHCLTTELILDKKGQKMSKSKGNTVAPWDVLNEDGADALRWYLITTSPPWSPTRFDRDGVKETSRKMLDTVRNVYSFFAMYASIDGYRHDPEDGGEPNLLDRWILSRFHSTTEKTRRHLDEYDVTRAARLIQQFTLDELSNWYVRRSRRRFWKGEMGPDKRAAYHTLYTVLDGLSKLIAPFVPFLAEELFLALRGKTGENAGGLSVHLESFPEPDTGAVDATLEAQMEMALAVSSLGRTVRNDVGIKTRQPLSSLWVHSDDAGRAQRVLENDEIAALVRDELNVRTIEVADGLGDYVTLSARPNFPALGKRFGKRVPAVAEAVRALDTDALMGFNRDGSVALSVDGDSVELGREELSVEVAATEGYGAAEHRGVTVVMNLVLDDDLRLEGAAREIINRLQNLRKQAGFDVTDRIAVRYQGGEAAQRVFGAQGDLIASETLARKIDPREPGDWSATVSFELDGEPLELAIVKTD